MQKPSEAIIDQYFADIQNAASLVQTKLDARREAIGDLAHDHLQRAWHEIWVQLPVRPVAREAESGDQPCNPKMAAMKQILTFKEEVFGLMDDSMFDMSRQGLEAFAKDIDDALIAMNHARAEEVGPVIATSAGSSGRMLH